MSIFEVVMLLCFGAAWPLSIYKSYTTRKTTGKSILFLIIIEIGYFSGITHKILYKLDYVLILYIINSVMVFIDIMLYFRNKSIEAKLE